MNYNFENIKKRILVATGFFIKKDNFLLKNDVNERSISHKLAEYLGRLFRDYHVDCEYNKIRTETMTEEYIKKTLNLQINIIKSNDVDAKTVYPDIIIHKRENKKDNLLVIEIKKKKNSSSREFDITKLKTFTTELKYKWGLYLEFDATALNDMKWFKNGRELSSYEASKEV